MDCPVCHTENPTEARFCQRCGAPMPDPEADAGGLIGQVIGGRYRIKRVIGEGGMGVVYEAEQRMGEGMRKVAIKTLLPELSSDHAIVSRFHRESGTVAQLEHPNTIRFYDFGETPTGQLYIAMEYVKGRSLTELIEEGPVPAERTLRILRQVCGALEEAHGLGIVHRDLKPDNIVLTARAGEEDFVKVLDFGIAKRIGPQSDKQTKLTQQGMVLGTPPYMSPEQLAGETVSAESDIYSLGVIAYEMLTGRLPFEADTPWQWASKHMTEAPAPPSTVSAAPIPERVERAVLHALEKKREDRPRHALDFYRELSGEAPRAVRTEPGGPHTEPGGGSVVRGRTESAPVVPAYSTEAAVAAPIPPPPPPRRSRLGWVLAIGGISLGAGLAFAALTLKPAGPGSSGAEPGQPPGPAKSAEVEIAPLVDSAVTAEAPPPVAPPTAKPTKKPPPAKTTTPPITPPPPTATQPPPPPPPTATQPPPPPPPTAKPPGPKLPTRPSGPTGDAACDQSQSAARSGNIEGAVSLYNKCASTGGSAGALNTARARIQAAAPAVVKRRAFLGNCAGARSAANAASSIGAGGPAQSTLASTSCK